MYLLRRAAEIDAGRASVIALAILTWLSLVIAIDPAGSYPGGWAGPGLTVDEIFNVEQGVYLVEQARALGWYNLIPGTSLEAYRRENGYLSDHPPLGRWWLGIHHHLAWWLFPPKDPAGPFVTACARTGSATAFALTIGLIGLYGFRNGRQRPLGRWSGLLAACALILMPRVYTHAHLAALETVTNLTCTAAVLAIGVWWNREQPPGLRTAALTGLIFGLALLTKIQAILIPVPVAVWVLFRWRQRGLAPLAVWGLTGVAVVFLAWPYLWLDPVAHSLEYLGRTTNRATLWCYYLGSRFMDRNVPWHYPFVMTAITIPIAVLVFGVIGVIVNLRQNSDSSRRPGEGSLLVGCALFPLLVFAIPGVAVYDGERLFLTVFPLWALLAGRGAVALVTGISRFVPARTVAVGLALGIVAQGVWNCQFLPAGLSYYNLLVGGRRGADRLGLELDYWGDALTRNVLATVVQAEPDIAEIQIRPSLHPYQAADLWSQSPLLRAARSGTGQGQRVTLAFRRRAELPDDEFLRYQPIGKIPLAGYRTEPQQGLSP